MIAVIVIIVRPGRSRHVWRASTTGSSSAATRSTTPGARSTCSSSAGTTSSPTWSRRSRATWSTSRRRSPRSSRRAPRPSAPAPQGPQAQAQAENMLTGALRQLFAVVENYPDLKANQNFMALQEELTATENKIVVRAAVLQRQRPDLQQQDPACSPRNIIAGMFNFTERAVLRGADEAEREVPKVDLQRSARRPRPSAARCTSRSRRNRRASWLLMGVVVAVLHAARASSSASPGSAATSGGLGLLGVFGVVRHRLEPRRLLRRRRHGPGRSAAPTQVTHDDEPAALERRRGDDDRRRPAAAAGVYVIDDSAPNAFATGRDPQHAVRRGHQRPAREARTATSCRASSPTRCPTCATTTSASRRSSASSSA